MNTTATFLTHRTGYHNPIIGYWDGLGYTRCPTVACAGPDPLDHPEAMAIDSGNAAVIGCVCDTCGHDIGADYNPRNRVHASELRTHRD